ncbi:family 18 glycosyl hydrolase [Plectosphaerella plurivora]|uniref:chitinase n=1 Tax=Plectosphaerella plurivora TaxID=936078 RepID=A0A9P8V9C4_9PEZI|nr:family 18 glycosyl hydrolase [Plectosphaerella plurivora]
MSRMAAPMALAPPSGTYRNVVYFTNWGIYAANHQPSNIQAGVITHLLYSFADIKPDGEVVGSDAYADVEKRFPGDVWAAGTNVYGCVKQLYLLKKKNRKMRVLLSIGGWTWSSKFAPVAATETGRRRFATTAVRLMGDWGFDGLDIDWEYPQDATQANNFVLLLQACRKALTEYSTAYAKGYHFALTIAVPAGKPNYRKLNMKGMIPYIDSWHLMAYDYAGSWESTTGHQSNIYARSNVAAAIKADTDSALTYYLGQGVDSRKIMLGLPLYGRSFAKTAGLGQPYSGVGQGSIEKGIWHYKALPRPGAVEYWDAKAMATWSYDAKTKELVTYDNPQAARVKTSYLLSKKLGGAIFWESSGDKTGDASLVRTVATGMKNLDPMQNWLSYPASKYNNMRKEMK